LIALTFPHFAALDSIRQHYPSSSRAVRVNETMSAKVRLFVAVEDRAFGSSESGGGPLWLQGLLR
jgi:hypothetical protein